MLVSMNTDIAKLQAIDEFAIQQTLNSKTHTSSQGTVAIDADFKKTAIDSMKSFIFAGHDTTSSTVCFLYHCLSIHPLSAARMREEHDEVFGSNGEDVGELLRGDAGLLNKLPYTTNFIKGRFFWFFAVVERHSVKRSLWLT